MNAVASIITLLATVASSGLYLNGTFKNGIFARNWKGSVCQLFLVALGQVGVYKLPQVADWLKELNVIGVSVGLAIAILTLLAWKSLRFFTNKGRVNCQEIRSLDKPKLGGFAELKSAINKIPLALLKMPSQDTLKKHPDAVYIEDENCCELTDEGCKCAADKCLQKALDAINIEDSACEVEENRCKCDNVTENLLKKLSNFTAKNKAELTSQDYGQEVKVKCLKSPLITPCNVKLQCCKVNVPVAPVLAKIGDKSEMNTTAAICIEGEVKFNYSNALKQKIGDYAADEDVVWRVLERKNIHMDLIIPNMLKGQSQVLANAEPDGANDDVIKTKN